MAEGDAVLHVHGHLQGLAREHWRVLEERHVGHVSWLRSELALISQSLEMKPRFENQNAMSAAPFPRSLDEAWETTGPALKKQKTENRTENPKKTRKRGRPSQQLLQDPGKLKVVELRSELKKRGLRTSGLKAALFDRLLDALEEEQKEEEQLEKVVEDTGEDKQTPDVIVIDDDADEIVRESVGSNKSPGGNVRSQSTSPKAVGLIEVENVSLDEDDDLHRSTTAQSTSRDDEGSNTDRSIRREETPATGVETESDSDKVQQGLSSQTTRPDEGFAIANGAKDAVVYDDLMLTRKSMQLVAKSALPSPLASKRKSILRKTSSLAPITRGSDRKVSFAPTDKVDIIFESSQTDSTQPDSSPEKATLFELTQPDPSPEKPTLSDLTQPDPSPEKPALSDSTKQGSSLEKPSLSDDDHSPCDDSKVDDNLSVISEAEAKPQSVETPLTRLSASAEDPTSKPQSVGTPVASASASTEDLAPIQPVPEPETEEERKEREFQEDVAREAQRLRKAAKLSAKKRLEEAKATKAFWAKRNELKRKLQDLSTGDNNTKAQTPTSDNSAAEHISLSTSEPLRTDVRSFPASKEGARTKDLTLTQELPESAAKYHSSVRSIARHDVVEEISNVSSTFESVLHEPKAARSTYSVVEEGHQSERLMSHRIGEKPTAKSLPATVTVPQANDHSVELAIKKLPRQDFGDSALLMSKTSYDTKKPGFPSIQMSEQLETRTRSDSLSSTVSSIPDPSVVENTLKSGASTTDNGSRRPISNLVSGVRSFTSLLEKNFSQESTSGRSAPVVNALKLAERSRLQEEKKQLEKEKRKALLRKKMEEHKKAAVLKQKAEKDVQAKREQERFNERKKREAELAKKRQQKLKEMRAGLEKKRAMLAAERKSAYASASRPAASNSSTSQHKNRGLAVASEASQASPPKAVQKPSSKPAPVSRPATKIVAKPALKPGLTSPPAAKHAPTSHSPEIVNYEMSDNAESSDGDSSDSNTERHGKKKVPRWAQRDHLNKILHAQFGKNAVDPSPAVFHDFVDTCNLEAIFETTDIRKKKKFARRTSSGNWLADRPTARDRALYQRDMGYKR